MDKDKLLGFYRAKVVEVDIERNKYGAVRVFIPDIMESETVKKSDPSFNESKSGIIAYPANDPLGGYNMDDISSAYCTTVYVPPKGSWVWVFFEGGDPARPFYFSAFKYRASELPPENKNVVFPHKVYTIIKTGEGRSIIVSDTPEHARVEITGKRRLLPLPPTGNPASSYTIEGNMTTILLEETPGSEQVLVKTYKGDYLKLSIEKRTLDIYIESDISIQTKGNITVQADGNIDVQSKQNININANSNINTQSGESTNITAVGSVNINSNGPGKISIGGGFQALFNSDVYVRGSSTANVEIAKLNIDNETVRTSNIDKLVVNKLNVGSCNLK